MGRIVHGGRPLRLFPVFLFRRGPFRILASPPLAATPYLGPVLQDERFQEVLAALQRFARMQSVAYLELRLAADLAAGTWAAAGFEREARATHVLDLQPGVDSLWQHTLDPACRRAVRKVEREGVEIREAPLGAIVERYYELATMVFARHDRPPPLSKDDYLRIAGAIERGATARVLTAMHGEKIVAAGIFPYDHRCIHYLDGVRDRTAQAVRPNNLLHWEVICWASRNGLEEYDMVGAGIPGVARFKSNAAFATGAGLARILEKGPP